MTNDAIAMTNKELIEKVTAIFDLEAIMNRMPPGAEREAVQARHLAMNDALPPLNIIPLALLIRGIARDISLLHRHEALLATLETELQAAQENTTWKRTNGQDSRAVAEKKADIDDCNIRIKRKKADIAKRQAFFDYLETTDRYIEELDAAAVGLRPIPARFQAQLDAEWSAKRESCRRSYEEYERSLQEQKDEPPA